MLKKIYSFRTHLLYLRIAYMYGSGNAWECDECKPSFFHEYGCSNDEHRNPILNFLFRKDK